MGGARGGLQQALPAMPLRPKRLRRFSVSGGATPDMFTLVFVLAQVTSGSIRPANAALIKVDKDDKGR
jgi:hypothetical protein